MTIDPALVGVELEAAVGHEGQHLADAQAFFGSFTENGAYDLSLNRTHADLETRAYWITQKILEVSNTPMDFQGPGGRRMEIGRRLPDKKVEKTIEKIVNGPLYEGKRNIRQFPNYN